MHIYLYFRIYKATYELYLKSHSGPRTSSLVDVRFVLSTFNRPVSYPWNLRRKIILQTSILGFHVSHTVAAWTLPHTQGRVMTVDGDGIASGSHVAILQRPVLPGGSAFNERFNDLLWVVGPKWRTLRSNHGFVARNIWMEWFWVLDVSGLGFLNGNNIYIHLLAVICLKLFAKYFLCNICFWFWYKVGLVGYIPF